jgi:hypothetical protein
MKKSSERVRFLPLQTYSFLILFALSFHLLAAVNIRGSDDAVELEAMILLARAQTVQHTPPEIAAEFTGKGRPALQIVLASFIVQAAAESAITNIYTQAAILRILSGLLGISLSLMLFITYRGQCTGDAGRTWLMSFLLLLWFLTPIHVSYSGEAWSGMLFFFGLAWFLRRDKLEDASNILAGIPMGLALFFRFESWALIAGLFMWLWFSEREHARVLATLALGIAVAALIGVLADRRFYGEWTFTPWNALVSFAATGPSGHAPWWFYFDLILRHGVYPIGALILLTGLFFFVVLRKDALTWVVLPYLALQIILPGKDLRFLYPVASAVPVMIFLSMQRVYTWIRPEQFRERIGRILVWALQPLWGINLILLVLLSFLPVEAYAPLYRRISNEPGWHRPAGHFIEKSPIAQEPGRLPRGAQPTEEISAPLQVTAHRGSTLSWNVGCAAAIVRKRSSGTTSNSGPSLSSIPFTLFMSLVSRT